MEKTAVTSEFDGDGGGGIYFSTNEITYDSSTGKYNQVTPKWDHIIVSGSEVTQSDRCLDGKNSRRFRVRLDTGRAVASEFDEDGEGGFIFRRTKSTYDTSTGKYNQITPLWDHIIVSGSEVTQSDRCLDGKNSRHFRVRWRRGRGDLFFDERNHLRQLDRQIQSSHS